MCAELIFQEVKERSGGIMFTFVGIVTGIARIIIWLVKFALKILLIPVIIGLTLLEWICTIAVGFFGPRFDIFGVVLIATGFLSYGFGLDPLSEMWRTVGYGVAFCMFPLVGGWIIERITLLNLQMSLWLHR